MNLAIIGSRDFPNLGLVTDHVRQLPSDTVVISGGARGVDKVAATAARAAGLAVREFLPDWNRYGKSAGFKRNTRIVEAADRVTAFWDGRSRGTADTIEKARQAGLIVTIIRPDGAHTTPKPVDDNSFDDTDPQDGATRAEYEDARAREGGDDYTEPLTKHPHLDGRPKTKLLTTKLKWICAAKSKTRESRSGQTLDYFTQALFTTLGNRVILTYDAGTQPLTAGPGKGRAVEVYGRDKTDPVKNADGSLTVFIAGAEVIFPRGPSDPPVNSSRVGSASAPATQPRPDLELRRQLAAFRCDLDYADTDLDARTRRIETLALDLYHRERPTASSDNDATRELAAIVRDQLVDDAGTAIAVEIDADDAPAGVDMIDHDEEGAEGGTELRRATEPWADASIPLGATVDEDCWDCPARLGAACTRPGSCLMEIAA